MRTIRESKNFEAENWKYLAVGYYKGKAILKDEMESIFYMECKEAEAPIGTMVSEGVSVLPVEVLDKDERAEIMWIYQEE